MPKRKSPQTLVSQCLKSICSSIEWFALHHYPQFDCLTSNLIGQIFNRLKTTPGLTASHFQLVLTEHLNCIDLSNPYQHDSWDFYIDVALDMIRLRQPNLIRIDLSNVLRIPSIFWTDIVPSLSHLQVISLRSTNCADQQVLTIVKHCHNLRELDLSLCERITNWSVSNFYEESTVGIKLQHLDLMQTQVDERGIRSVLERCSGLSSLRWRNTINALGEIYRDRSGSMPHTSLPSYSLHQLISDNSYRLYSLQGAVQLCRQAVQVTIDSPSLLLAEELQVLGQLHCLRELRVVLSSYTRPELLLDFREGFDLIIMKHGSTLQHLSIGRIRNVDLERIAHCCHDLTSLSLELNHSYKYGEESTIMKTVQSLSKLNISIRDRESNDEDHSNHDVPGSCLKALISSPSIRQIKITASQNIDDQILFESVVSHDLESLELESCSNISMKSLWFVIDHSKRLSNLKVYRCQLVIERDIAKLYRMIEEHHWDLDVDYYSDS